MGVDCRVWLPAETRARDVAKVLGMLAGLPGSLEPLSNGGEHSIHLDVPGVECKPNPAVAGCSDIILSGPMIGKVPHAWVMFHHAFGPPGQPAEGGPAHVGIMPDSTPFWCALCAGVVEFFGGAMQFQDHGDEMDLEFERPRAWNNPCDGKPWADFQREMAEVKPTTIAAFRDKAAYR